MIAFEIVIIITEMLRISESYYNVIVVHYICLLRSKVSLKCRI